MAEIVRFNGINYTMDKVTRTVGSGNENISQHIIMIDIL